MSELVNLVETALVKAENAFCVTLRDGRLPLEVAHPLGLYRNDCRHLRGRELLLAGIRPRLLVASDGAGSAAVFELTNPQQTLGDGRPLAAQSLRLRVERRATPDGMLELITMRSYAEDPVLLDFELRLAADFAPMLEVRGLVEPNEREVRVDVDGDTLRLAAEGLDGRCRSTTIRCAAASAHAAGSLRAAIALAPGETQAIEITYMLLDGRQRRRAARRLAAVGPLGAEPRAWLAERPRIDTHDELLDRAVRRSLLDLRLLASDLDGQAYYAAGVPWYATLFGRDSIVTALEVLAFDPALAEQTLRLLAGRLGSRVDDEHDEEPGKVIHELRVGEVAARGLTPLARYYGTVDATPLFLCLLCEHADWTGSLALFRELRPRVEAALGWIDDYGDLDSDGLLEYRCRSSAGLANQGWKDSHDAIVDEHGQPLQAPIALVEVQGYAMRAMRRLARLYELDGDPDRAAALRAQAAELAAGLERFWLPDRGFYAMALDADKRPSRALASNQGHLLWALAVPAERAAAIRDALLAQDAYSGWGVRTLGAGEPKFNPIGYHTGSVWPHDNAIFAAGLRKYGFDTEFQRVFDGLLDAAAGFDGYRLPELLAGFSRADYERPVPYPVACSPQAWAAGALPAMLTAGLGLIPDGLAGALRIRRPSLPGRVQRLTVSGLQVAGARVDLLFERANAETVALTDVDIDGQLEVVLEFAPEHAQDLAPRLADIQPASDGRPAQIGRR